MIFQPQIVGKPLPALTNPGTAADLLSGKQLIDANGNVLTGTLEEPPQLYGVRFTNNSSYRLSVYGTPMPGYVLSGESEIIYLYDGIILFAALEGSSRQPTNSVRVSTNLLLMETGEFYYVYRFFGADDKEVTVSDN